MRHILRNWILLLANGYVEYTTYGDRNVYRRTVDYNNIVWC